MSIFSRMKNAAALILSAALFAAGVPGAAAASASVTAETRSVAVGGKKFTVNTVTVDLSDPTLELVPVLSGGGIGHVESFASIIQRENAVAAINGTFFNAYEKNPYSRYPNGILMESGKVLHSGENQTLFLTADKIPDIEWVNLDVAVHVSEGGGTYTVRPWGVNKNYGPSSTDQIVWYTPEFGGWVGFSGGTKVVVTDGRITRITEDAVPVPEDGFVLFVGHSKNNRTHVLPKLDVGDTVKLELVSTGEGGRRLEAESWLAAIGVGPKLVTNGAADVDFSRDGFTDPKIMKASAARSFVGIDGANRLVMGTVDSATIQELAGIAIKLGLKEAMNMDGGASSALYANGRILTAPGRELSNVLIVRKLNRPRVQIEINGQYVPDFKGFIVNDTTVVPIRPFITALNAGFQWDAANRTATLTHGGVTIKLKDGSPTAIVSGKSVAVPVPIQILEDGRMYVPLRFVAETLNAKVEWNQKLYRASIRLP